MHRRRGTPDSCPICVAATSEGFERCRGCEIVGRQLGGPLVPVTAVLLADRGAAVHRLLVAYKAVPSTFVRVEASARLAGALASLLATWSVPLRHGVTRRDLAVKRAITLATVPSSGAGRPSWHGVHPLVEVVAQACSSPSLTDTSLWTPARALERGPGPLGHLRASGDAYVAAMPARSAAEHGVGTLTVPAPDVPRQVVVVDDLYTSGAHAQSAARALALAGYDVLGIVPLGRLVAADDPRAATFRAPPRVAPFPQPVAWRGTTWTQPDLRAPRSRGDRRTSPDAEVLR